MSIGLDAKAFGYGVIAAGTVLSFISATIPFYSVAYQLQFGVLVAGTTPYLTYGVLVTLQARRLTGVVGIILLVLHACLVVSERFVDGADYSDRTIYIAPLLFSVAIIPLIVVALRQPWHG